MKISTKGRYGLRILVDLATHDAEKPRLIRDIAESQGISEKYISRLVIDLRKAKMIRSIRGVNGGFHLAKSPEDITLLDVLEAMEGPLRFAECVSDPEQQPCAHSGSCPARGVWEYLTGEINALLTRITLLDIVSHKLHDTEKAMEETE